jgi:hypothetical protein
LSNHGRTRSKSALALTLGLFLSTTMSYPAHGFEYAQPTNQVQYAAPIRVTGPGITIQRDRMITAPAVASISSAPNYGASAAVGAGSLLDAARRQIGVNQDCTALVENALRAIGYSVGDVGPMGFSSYGISIPASEAQAGDIMMRGGHVAIYSGSGVAIHGGYNGTTVETSLGSDPSNFSLIIRIQ